MKKTWYSIIMLLVLLSIQCVPAAAAESGGSTLPYVVEEAGLLSEEEKSALSDRLEEISSRQSCDIVVVTVTSIGDKSMMEYADDYYDTNGYGKGSDHSGVLLLIKMEEDGHGDYWISTCGYGITAFTDAGIDYIGENLVAYLKEKQYKEALEGFALDCDKFLTQAKTDTPYDLDNMPKEPMNVPQMLLISAVSGLLVALIVVMIMRSKLKSVAAKAGASEYMKPGSLQVSESKDIFLYSTVSKQKISTSSSSGGGSSTHTSSSGTSHGGGGGRF